jgi:hypothetical protein
MSAGTSDGSSKAASSSLVILEDTRVIRGRQNDADAAVMGGMVVRVGDGGLVCGLSRAWVVVWVEHNALFLHCQVPSRPCVRDSGASKNELAGNFAIVYWRLLSFPTRACALISS